MKIILTLIMLNCALVGQTHYVSKTGSSIPPYSSWNTAAKTIQDAIDISQSNDTIMVNPGTYEEGLRASKPLNLIGLDRESVIVDASLVSDTTVHFLSNCYISGLTLIGSGNNEQQHSIILIANGGTTIIKGCILMNGYEGISSIRSVYVEDCLFRNLTAGVALSDFDKDKHLFIKDCCFYMTNFGKAIIASPYGHVTIIGNLFQSASFNGMWSVFNNAFDVNTVIFKNNLCVSAKNNTIYMEMGVNDSLIVENNTIINQNKDFVTSAALFVRWPNYMSVKNNIFSDCFRNVLLYLTGTTELNFEYNLYWNIENLDSNYISENDYLERSPDFYIPFVNYDQPYDLHLEKYSMAIDAGDPSIIDKDGTRSDLGAFGGPGGISYEYPVWALPAVTNLEYNFQIGDPVVELNWDSLQIDNLFRYRVYRDTVYPSGINEDAFLAYSENCEYTDSNIGSESRYYYYVVGEDTVGRLGEISNIVAVVLTGVDDDGELHPTENRLYPNYPNPFNPETKINYHLKEASRVLLEILDIKGERVAVLVDGIQSRGHHTAIFNGSDLSSGVYVYRMQVISDKGETIYSQGNKMILLK